MQNIKNNQNFQNNFQKSNKLIVITNNIIRKNFQKFIYQIPSYYKILNIINIGAYGIVLSAINIENNEKVAIKKIVNLFEQSKCYQKRIFREIKIMKHFTTNCGHKNILPLVDLFLPINYTSFRDVYIVTPLMDFDLTCVTKKLQQATEKMVKYIMYQILESVRFFHSVKVVHRDLKPENMCTYVTTRWYRSPELLLEWPKSSFSCDLWSCGCILAELLCKPPNGCCNKTLFRGNGSCDQLQRIFAVLGKPKISKDHFYFTSDRAKTWVKTKVSDNIRVTNIKQLFQYSSKEAVDLLEKLLVLDPMKRISAEEALNHDFFKYIRENLQTPTTTPVSFNCNDDMDECMNDDFDFRIKESDFDNLKSAFYQEILDWNKEQGRSCNAVLGKEVKYIDLNQ